MIKDNYNDIIGTKIGEYFIEKEVEYKGSRCAVCVCGCGKQKIYTLAHLRRCKKENRNMKCKSCSAIEINKKAKIKHGLLTHPLYHIWINMRERCNNVNAKDYKNYGGRGIHVCEEWNNFINFYNFSINHLWKEGLQIDRINNNGDYSPGNCRFVTAQENSYNKRNTIYIEGKTVLEIWNLYKHKAHPSVTLSNFRDRYIYRHWTLIDSLSKEVRRK